MLTKQSLGFLSIIIATVVVVCPPAMAKNNLTDISIRDAVEDELIVDPAISKSGIDISITDGVVTLTGVVDNILNKDRAAKIAETVKGVRAVVNNIAVVPPLMRTDAEIKKSVEAALFRDPATESFEIMVNVKDNTVTLSGTVDSWPERFLAEKVAKGVKGVTGIKNEIDVRYQSIRPDKEIKNDIEQRLKWDVLVDHALIDVNIDGGRVTLTGVVGSAAEKSQAEYNAYVAGIKSVNISGLKVERWARDEDLRKDKYAVKSDNQIEKALTEAMVIDPRVSSFNVDTDVNAGIVTLRGQVDNLKAKRAAEQDARNTVGVIRVENRLKVRPQEKISDRKIADEIRDALLADPYVERFEITVYVVNGIANLYGTVDSYFEKTQADDVASKIEGVVAVNNNLTVRDSNKPYTYDPYLGDYYIYNSDWYAYEPNYPFKSDPKIKQDIKDEMWWSPFVDEDQVNVTVENGVAHLTGTVDSWTELNAATENALEGGATWVDNDIVVK